MKRLGWGLSLAAGAMLISTPSLAVMHLQCATGTACAGGAQNCHTEQVCWTIWEFDPFTFVTDPIGNDPGVDVPWRPADDNTDAVTDCWKNVTIGADDSSGFPYRNNPPTATHDGVDITSTAPNSGRGAPVGSLGAGYVIAAGFSNANGNFVRVMQGDGNTVTYIHLLRYIVAVGNEVRVGTQVGEMNCTGDCGGPVGSPERGKINHTHVHIQVKRTNDDAMFLDAVELYGGENCSVSPNGQPTPPGLPGQQCPFAPQRSLGSPWSSPQQRNCP